MYCHLVRVPPAPRKELIQFLKKISSFVPDLNAVDVDIPLNVLCTDDMKLEQVALGREFHISLGRTVPIGVQQIDSVVAMLRQKLQFQKRSYIFPVYDDIAQLVSVKSASTLSYYMVLTLCMI